MFQCSGETFNDDVYLKQLTGREDVSKAVVAFERFQECSALNQTKIIYLRLWC